MSAGRDERDLGASRGEGTACRVLAAHDGCKARALGTGNVFSATYGRRPRGTSVRNRDRTNNSDAIRNRACHRYTARNVYASERFLHGDCTHRSHCGGCGADAAGTPHGDEPDAGGRSAGTAAAHRRRREHLAGDSVDAAHRPPRGRSRSSATIPTCRCPAASCTGWSTTSRRTATGVPENLPIDPAAPMPRRLPARCKGCRASSGRSIAGPRRHRASRITITSRSTRSTSAGLPHGLTKARARRGDAGPHRRPGRAGRHLRAQAAHSAARTLRTPWPTRR